MQCATTPQKNQKTREHHLRLRLMKHIPRALCAIVLSFAHEFIGCRVFLTYGNECNVVDKMILIKTLKGNMTIINMETNKIIWQQSLKIVFREQMQQNVDWDYARYIRLFLLKPHHVLVEALGGVFRADITTNQVTQIFHDILQISRGGTSESVWIGNHDWSRFLFNNVTNLTAPFEMPDTNPTTIHKIARGSIQHTALESFYFGWNTTATCIWVCKLNFEFTTFELKFCYAGTPCKTLAFDLQTALFETTHGVFALKIDGKLFTIHTKNDEPYCSFLCDFPLEARFEGEMIDETLVFSDERYVFTTDKHFGQHRRLYTKKRSINCHVGDDFVIVKDGHFITCFM